MYLGFRFDLEEEINSTIQEFRNAKWCRKSLFAPCLPGQVGLSMTQNQSEPNSSQSERWIRKEKNNHDKRAQIS